MSENKREVIFLFGAGASVDAEIPDTYTFVEEFESYIKREHPKLFDSLSKIKKVCESFNGKDNCKVDIEQLLGIVRRLTNRDSDLLLAFYEEKKFSLDVAEENFGKLQTILEDFIRERVIAKEEKLKYLQELLNFDTPLEIYSTNYDTCIEQLSYRNHRRYTDGFDISWNPKNFEENYDIKHYKMHGSIIWYENTKTKECVKIPVRAFSDEGKPVHLKLIYQEDVKPLLIYPAQKAEYIEPLTDLQLKFKERLFDKDITKVLVIVGYSFRDKYIRHMLWDAARVNERLHIIMISPNANEIFEKNLKYIDKDSKSRLHDRVICLPYPFATVIYKLKNYYLQNLTELLKNEEINIKEKKQGHNVNWITPLRNAIDCEFLTKAESIIEKLDSDWESGDTFAYSEEMWLHYAIKGLLSSILINDGNENNWIKRANKSLERFNVENLHVKSVNSTGLDIQFQYRTERRGTISRGLREFKEGWLEPIFSIIDYKIRLLGTYKDNLDKIKGNLDSLKKFEQYICSLNESLGSWDKYLMARKNDKGISELETTLSKMTRLQWGKKEYLDKIPPILIEIEKRTFKEIIGDGKVQFKPFAH